MMGFVNFLHELSKDFLLTFLQEKIKTKNAYRKLLARVHKGAKVHIGLLPEFDHL
jgi:hypothetical protein